MVINKFRWIFVRLQRKFLVNKKSLLKKVILAIFDYKNQEKILNTLTCDIKIWIKK